VADVGCGTGHAMVLLAGAFPASTFVGYNLAEDAIARARSESAGLANLDFEVRDVARLEVERPFDVVFVFDAIHDQVDPAACWPASTPPWPPAAPSFWSSRGPPATWRTTWATPWRRSSTGSAPCTA
jgi:SAM-dependent methyltransferase